MVSKDETEEKYGKTSGRPFRPPLPNPLILGLVKSNFPFLVQKILKGFNVHIDDVSLNRLKAIQGERCLLLPNHPTEWDPWVIFSISRMLKEQFFFLAAREVFDWHHGMQGWLMQRVGCYSIVRGASDRDSFKTTKDILSNNKGRLVIFVEGEISSQNDSLLPLESGVVQLAFLSLQDVYKKNGKDLATLPPLYICPIALKYFYHPQGIENSINTSLENLEKALGLSFETEEIYPRIRRIGMTVLRGMSRQFGYQPIENDSLNDQINGLKDYMLQKLEHVINLEKGELGYLDRIRNIQNKIDTLLMDTSEVGMTAYDKRLFQHQKDVLQNFGVDLRRIVNFIALYEGYIMPEGVLPERYAEVIFRLEREVFGEVKFKHPRTAHVEVQEPINVKNDFESFLTDKRGTAESITRQIEQAIYQGITQAQRS